MRPANAYMDLVFHALAFVPPPAPAPAIALAATLFDPEYVANARRSLPAELVSPFDEHAALLSAAFRDAGTATTIQRLALLHASLEEASQCALVDLRDIPDTCCSAPERDALLSMPEAPVEILRTSCALAASAFHRHHRSNLAPRIDGFLDVARTTLGELAALVPILTRIDIVVSATLGTHGRGFGDGVVIGIAGSQDLATPLHFALHEIAVEAASRTLGQAASYRMSERLAMLAVERALEGTPKVEAYRAWRSRFDLRFIAPPEEIDAASIEAVRLVLQGRRDSPTS